MTRHWWRFTLLMLILLLGWLLRTHNLDVRSLWADEGWTMLLSTGPNLDDVAQTIAEDQHPPLFFMAFRLWRDVAGDSEFATRYFSVLISMLAVAALYQLGRELYGAWVGVLAALVLALADLPIDLAQEVRHYTLLVTLSVLSTLFYVRWRRDPSRTNRVSYVLLSMALLYTHYLGGYVLLAQL
ncbi:MAG: glycosyltransferase family 39 protein, partial [Anaerolineae bacterium]|nr:glycosyltransferase family 39 protein [Anaerolineae bacterium]